MPRSSRLITAAGFVAAVAGLGIAGCAGAARVPPSAGPAKAPRSAASIPVPIQHTVSRYRHLPATVEPSQVAHRPGSSATSPVTLQPTERPTVRPTVTPAVTPAAAPSSPRPTASPVLVPTPTVEYQTPAGRNELAWSQAILRGFGDPLTSANIVSIGYWMQNEAGHPPYGIVGANNPINVSEPGYGGTPIQNEGGGYFLYSYPTVKDGIEAIVAYLNRPNYTGILAALKAGVGLSSPSLAQEFSVYSGGGYTSVPDSWGASQGRPQT